MTIAEIADNNFAKNVYLPIRAKLNTVTHLTLPYHNRDTLTYTEHLDIYKAIKRGDPELAAKAGGEHMNQVSLVLLEILRERESLCSMGQLDQYLRNFR